ncbi:MAG TPA: hypothetical protein VFG42_17710 [Baekduia sp.]|uniref:hypothetical protein n=1 Tax=Baekduia sp. TaxID=2600305 RepID=UPI002D798766|nr:hypothetical protein [Baekduia sp.]HET6508634.1 hypothetical protein [Baekduia sp.]
MSSRRARALAAPALAVLLLAPAAAAAGAATTPDPGLARFVAPADHAVVRGTSVRVVVRLRADAGHFEATLGGRDVTQRFTAAGRTRTAVLPVSGLVPGDVSVKVHTRTAKGVRDVDTRVIAVVRRSASLLTATAQRRDAGTTTVRLRVRRPEVAVTARLNGHAVDAVRTGSRERTLTLSADDGLRHGVNHLRLETVDADHGEYDVETRAIAIARTAPIAAAGRDRRATLGGTAVLSAARARAAHRGSALRYRWEVVRAPRGSKAKLATATAMRPRLKPDRPGTYRVRLRVTETRRGAAAHAADAIADADADADADTMTLRVAPSTPAIGLPVTTIAATRSAPGVTVGTTVYPAPAGAAIQVVVLDRATLEPRSNKGYGSSDAATQQLQVDLAALTSADLVIVATPGLGRTAPAADATAVSHIDAALASIGASPLANDPLATVACDITLAGACSGFSAIGIPGLPVGQGTVNPGLAPGNGLPAGSIHGYLRQDVHDNYAYADDDAVPFDTDAPGTTPTQAVVTVGGQTYTSNALVAPRAGVFVLVLDAGSLYPRAQDTFTTRGGSVDTIVTDLVRMHQLLSTYANDPSALVIVQSIGQINRWDAYEGRGDLPYWWNIAANDQQQLGGHALLFDALGDDPLAKDVNDDLLPNYALVAPEGYGDQEGRPLAPWARVASRAASDSPGLLRGTLARNSASQYYAKYAGASTVTSDELPAIVYQQATPWPLRNQPGPAAAIDCVGEAVGLKRLPVEANYASGADKLAWGSFSATMADMDYDSLAQDYPVSSYDACDPSRFTADDLHAAKVQLHKEWTDVPLVLALFDRLEYPISSERQNVFDRISSITDAIESDVNAPRYDVPDDHILDYAEDTFLTLGAMPEVLPEEAAIAGALKGMDLLASMIGLASDTLTDEDGEKQTEASVTSTADQLGNQIKTQLGAEAQGLGTMEDILLDDWGKLDAVAGRAQLSWAWDVGDQDTVATIQAISDRAVSIRAYEALFPLQFDGLIRQTGTLGADLPTDPRQYPCNQGSTAFSLFSGMANGGGFGVTTTAGPVSENWVFAKAYPQNADDGTNRILRPLGDDRPAPTFPGQSLTDDMFNSVDTEIGRPLMQPLGFALDILGSLKTTRIAHQTVEFGPGGTTINWPGKGQCVVQ